MVIDIFEIHSRLDSALDFLAQARIEIMCASKLARNPKVSYALTAIFKAYAATEAAKAKVAQEIDEARQMPLEEQSE